MTNFENLKSMTQDKAVKYIRYGMCKIYGDCCKICPMNYSCDEESANCISDIFADWLEMSAKET